MVIMMFRPITLQEANLFLPLIRERFTHIHALVSEGQALQASVDTSKKADQQPSAGEDATQQPAENLLSPGQEAAMERVAQIEQAIRDQVLDMQRFGAIIKSVFPARVDFLAERHQQPVYLCWKTGDRGVSHWHPVDEGFATRRKIKLPDGFTKPVIH